MARTSWGGRSDGGGGDGLEAGLGGGGACCFGGGGGADIGAAWLAPPALAPSPL